jgi:hypothetical protein
MTGMRHYTSHRFSPALAVAVCALLVALGGTSYAVASLPKHSVGAAQLKKNAVRSKAVKNQSLTAKDFRAGELLPKVFLKDSGGDSVAVTALVAGPDTVVGSMPLQAGSYYVQATVVGYNQSAALQAELRCTLRSTGDTTAAGTVGLFVPIEPNAGSNADRAFFTLDTAYDLATPGTVSVECTKGAAGQDVAASASISALETQTAVDVP